jgi:thiol-disulfide isomerase/thioredoxin
MALRSGTEMPDITGVTEWLNGEPDFTKVKSGPTLIAFWAVSCHICHDNMPTVREWKAKYEPMGLNFVSIHMPRQEEDTDLSKVKEQVAAYGIDEPCGVDNLHQAAQAFENEWVPAYFLFDAEGKLKYRAAGEFGLKMLQTALEKMFEGN